MGQRSVQEYLVNGVMSLYQDCKTTVSVEGELSDSFSVKIKVYQESALGPLLFAIVIDVSTEDARTVH